MKTLPSSLFRRSAVGNDRGAESSTGNCDRPPTCTYARRLPRFTAEIAVVIGAGRGLTRPSLAAGVGIHHDLALPPAVSIDRADRRPRSAEFHLSEALTSEVSAPARRRANGVAWDVHRHDMNWKVYEQSDSVRNRYLRRSGSRLHLVEIS